MPTIIDNLKVAIEAVEAQPEIRLIEWRTERECGTLFCIAGLCATLSHFNAQGLYADPDGAPCTNTHMGPFTCLSQFFGEYGEGEYGPEESAYEHIFSPCGDSPWDAELLSHIEAADLTDKDLALARLRHALAIQEARL